MSTLAATSTLFGTKQKNSISLVKELRAAGLVLYVSIVAEKNFLNGRGSGDSEVKLWRIAVIGNQSSGESQFVPL